MRFDLGGCPGCTVGRVCKVFKKHTKRSVRGLSPCGFRSVDPSLFRPASLEKGSTFFDATNSSFVTGCVTLEMRASSDAIERNSCIFGTRTPG